MKRYTAVLFLLVAFFYFSTTGYQCGSAEMTTAKLAMQQQQWDKAEESLMKELLKNESNEEAWFLLGQVRLELKKYAAMNEAYTKALALSDAHRPEIQRNRLAIWAQLYNDGVNNYNKGRESPESYDSAIEKFDLAIRLVPDSASTYYVAALAYVAKENDQAAIKMLETSLQKNPKRAQAARLLAQIHQSVAQTKEGAAKVEELNKAAAAYEKAYAADPTDIESMLGLIDVYERAGQSEKALELTKNCVAAEPDNKVCRYAYGVYLLKQEKFDASIEQLKKATELEPDVQDEIYQDATYNLGVAYLNWGVAMKGEADKKAAADKYAKEDLTYKEKFKAALPFLEKSAEAKKSDAALWQQLGRLYANLNMVDKSKMAFDTADRLMKNN